MNEAKQNECEQDNKTLKMICEVEKLFKDDFDNWEGCYRQLIEATFDIKGDTSNKTYKKKGELKWLNDTFVKKYSMFKYLKDNDSNVFSFIVMLNKYGHKNRLEIARKILDNDECDTEFTGVPSGQQGLSENSFKDLNDDQLNKIAYQLIFDIEVNANEEVNNLTDTFKNVFYILAPEKYYPSDKNTKAILKKLGKCNGGCEPMKIKIANDNNESEYFSRALSYVAWQEENQVDNILNKFLDDEKEKPKNIILTGMPGTGKTYTVMKYLEDSYQKEQYDFVQFHPSYDYEDFIEGLKPVPSGNGQIEFKLVNGVFKNLCQKAYNDTGNTYVMVIDEINRANLSRVFGELLYCLEYRDEFISTKMTTYIQGLKEKQKDYSVSTEEENIGKFAIPQNVIILGTMNEVDRSIDAFDLALRRRFIWEEIEFSEMTLKLYAPFFAKGFQQHIKDLIEKANTLNKELKDEIGTNYQLGHTYYFKIADYFDGDLDSALCDLWDYHIKSIVREYCKVKFPENEIEGKLKKYKETIVGKKNCDG